MHGDFDRDVVSGIDRLDELIKLSEVSTAATLEFFQSLVEFCILRLDVFLALKLPQFKFLLQ